jgi:D-lactate dehydrogenase (cytochrome)
MTARSPADISARIEALVGSGHWLTAPEDVAPHLVERRGLFHGAALGVARPGDTAETAALVRICAESGLAVVPQGGNTGLVGGGVPPEHGRAVVVSTERLTRIRAVDPLNFTLTAEAGCILATLQQAAADVGCLFPLSLGAEGSCRIGGNLSTNAGGLNVLRYGTTRDLTLGLEVVLADGRVWDGLTALRKNNTGYDLKHLFIGAEGTLGIITAAVLKLFPALAGVETALIALPDPDAAVAILDRARRASGDAVTACELMPRIALDLVVAHVPRCRDPFAGRHPWYLLLEVSSSRPGTLRAGFEEMLSACLTDGLALDATLAESADQRQSLWRLRETIPEAQTAEGASIKHDVAVATHRVPELIRHATAAVEAALPGVRVVAFGHIGDGNVHFNLTQPADADPKAFLGEWEAMNRIVHDIVTDMAGSISAEHGIGRLKVAEMARTKSAVELDLMRRIKSAIDPAGIMNPGKVIPAPAGKTEPA